MVKLTQHNDNDVIFLYIYGGHYMLVTLYRIDSDKMNLNNYQPAVDMNVFCKCRMKNQSGK